MRRPLRFAPLLVAGLVLGACDDYVDPVAPALPPPSAAAAPRAAVAASTHPGSWTPKFTWPIVGVHLIVLPNGKVLTWSSSKFDYAFKIENVYLWDPATWSPMGPGPMVQQANDNTDLFCASHNFEADGKLFVTGGHAAPDSGDAEVNRYDYNGSPVWSMSASMTQGARWYPTSVTLPNGQTVTMGGTKGTNNWNNVPELWDGSSWRALPGATLQLPWYPWAFVAPNGLVFVAGSDSMSRYLDVSGTGKWINVAKSQFGRPRDRGSAVMYEPGKVLIFGGGGSTLSGPNYVGATNTAEIINLNDPVPAWKYTGSMSAKRRHVNSALLADGKVLAMGGTTNWNFDEANIKTVEMWDPATGVWTLLDSTNVVPRAYHGAAVLMTDARVLVSGSGRCPGCAMTDQFNAQIFTPPYLYNNDGTLAARPQITSAPAVVGYNQGFTVATPDAAGISGVTWVRMPAMTHSFDMNTRFMRLNFSGNVAGSSQLTVTAPANANVAPPGHYMLFLLNASGVPSLAKVVQIGGAVPPPPPAPPAAPSALAATAVGSSQINLAWTDNAGDETGFEIERCTGAGCGTFAPLTTVAANTTTYQNAGLPASTTYGYRVRAVKSELASAYSNEVSATTGATAPSAPSAPTGIAAAATSSSQIVVSWTDNSTDETAFRVERCTGAGCQSFAEVATLPAGATNYTNGGLTASTTYGYRVRAERSGVFSSYSATAAATTTAASAPAISLSATASKVKGTQKVALSWSGAANGTSGTVTITRTGAAEASFTVPNTGSYTDNIDRKGGGSYTYTVCEKDTPTRCSDSATVTF